MANAIVLDMEELRALTAYAAESAAEVRALYERDRPDDSRPRQAIDTAWAFARGDRRSKALRDAAWAAMRAAQEAEDAAAGYAARAAIASCSAAYLHPLARATQVKHIVGSAAYAARAAELAAGDEPEVGVGHIERAARRAPTAVVDVLRRYPPAPAGGGRAGELIRLLDERLRRAGADATGEPAYLVLRRSAR